MLKLHATTHLGRALIAALALATTGTLGFAADAQYFLNDPLATTVAITDAAGEIATIEADAFGAPLAIGEAPGRFTGKPYDADIGAYVFPFRNYRPEEARWMSADPSGFPDGVNGRIYITNPLLFLDPNGLNIILINNSNSVAGAGRSAAIIQSGSDWIYNSYGSGPGGSGISSSSNENNLTVRIFDSKEAAINHAANLGYDRGIEYVTTSAQDIAAQNVASSWQGTNYGLFQHNCVHMIRDIFDTLGIANGDNWVPNTHFNQSNAIRNGTRINIE
jgi:RHS repeat-associated protein